MVSFSLQQFLQGRNPPLPLGTMCSGNAQGLFDFCIIPIFSISRYSFFADASLSGVRRRDRAKTGRSLVGLKCFTPCLTSAVEKVGCKISGWPLRIFRNLLLVGSMRARTESTEIELTEQLIGEEESASISL